VYLLWAVGTAAALTLWGPTVVWVEERDYTHNSVPCTKGEGESLPAFNDFCGMSPSDWDVFNGRGRDLLWGKVVVARRLARLTWAAAVTLGVTLGAGHLFRPVPHAEAVGMALLNFLFWAQAINAETWEAERGRGEPTLRSVPWGAAWAGVLATTIHTLLCFSRGGD
jgi:hypothetical protein